MDRSSPILIIGQNGILLQALVRHFTGRGFASVEHSVGSALDVLDQDAVSRHFETRKPQYIFLCSTRSGGIAVNQRFPGEFIYHNLVSMANVVEAARKTGIKKLMYLAGSCAYPKEAEQPIKETSLLSGPLEMTSEPYAVAKIAGIKLCQSYRRQYGFPSIVGVPATVYGPGNDTDPQTAHVISALIAKFHDAVRHRHNTVTVWGTGKPRREFLYAEDFASACEFLMDYYDEHDMINIGNGEDVSIKELADVIKGIAGFRGEVVIDTSKPDGTMRKLMDNSRLSAMGWEAKTSLQEGIRRTYEWYAGQHS